MRSLKVWGLVGAAVKSDQRAISAQQCECAARTVIRDVWIPYRTWNQCTKVTCAGWSPWQSWQQQDNVPCIIEIILFICTGVRNHTHSRDGSRLKTCLTRSGHGLELLWKSILLSNVLCFCPVRRWVRGAGSDLKKIPFFRSLYAELVRAGENL